MAAAFEITPRRSSGIGPGGGKDVNVIKPDDKPPEQRPVYLLSRRLGNKTSTPTGNPLIQPRAAVFAHWGLHAGDYVHELVEVGGQCYYHNSPYTSNSGWTRSEKRGVTWWRDYAIYEKGMEIIKWNRTYNAVGNNCHTFFTNLCNCLTEGATAPIQHVDSL